MLAFLLAAQGLSAPKCVSVDALNVRSGPGTGYGVKGSLSNGQGVDVVSTSNGWSKLGDGTYVYAQYLGNCNVRKMCTTAPLNVRKAPSTGSVIKLLPEGGSVNVYGKAVNGWNVIGDGQYVSASYLGNCGGGGSGGGDASSDIVEITLRKVLSSEGRCQNWAQDSGNYLNGKLGYTCAGITPSVGYNQRNGAFKYASSCTSRSAEMFVKCAWDISESQFIKGAGEVYTQNYFKPGGCSTFKQPLHYVCSDIAVNSGVGRSKQYLNQLGAVGSDLKGYARRMNELHRQDYIRWSMPGTANARFRQGWLNRAAERDRFIDSY